MTKELLESIKKEIQEYHEMSFDDEKVEFEYNTSLKNKLKQLIIDSKDDTKMIEQSLLVLAQSTGCAEDQEIAEEIISYLEDNKYIDAKQVDYFYAHVATGRWR